MASRECAAWRLVVPDGDISFCLSQDLDYKTALMLSGLKHIHFLWPHNVMLRAGREEFKTVEEEEDEPLLIPQEGKRYEIAQ